MAGSSTTTYLYSRGFSTEPLLMTFFDFVFLAFFPQCGRLSWFVRQHFSAL